MINKLISTIWLFNIAMENCPCIDGLPINSMVISHGHLYHGYVSHNQMVYIYIYLVNDG